MITSDEFQALFDEAGYLAKFPDVAEGVQNGYWMNGWHHFSRRGQFEGRTMAGFNLINYRRAFPPDAAERIPPGQEPEPVRLVIWDLDDTFWRGTVTEGGIEQYIDEHHDIVIELAKRGIMSSICSKNDPDTIIRILKEKGIFDYFIFPSISWAPKGGRIAALIETVQLRPATVMFIDDNPGNRAEAATMVPELQIADETFISKILDDPYFKGKDDAELTRLAQYKVLETREQDKVQSSGNNEEFLRGCDIRVHIEYDVLSHLDRAIELINRTNQLNYTKKRLSENIEEARRQLTEEITPFGRQAGLVSVKDKYGDYGYVGFFVTQSWRTEHVEGAATRTFRHLCFSCRTLGMNVEQWLYNFLGQPQLQVVGDVLTDLSVPRQIDWIRLVPTMSEATAQYDSVAPEIRLFGGCEAAALGVYLGSHTPKADVLANFSTGDLFVRVNSVAVALSSFDRSSEEFSQEAAILGLPLHLTARDYFADAEPGTVFIFSCGRDAERSPIYRHKRYGWDLVLEPTSFAALNFLTVTDDELRETIEARGDVAPFFLERVTAVAQHMRENYGSFRWQSDDEVLSAMRRLLDRVPVGSKFVMLLDHDKGRTGDNQVISTPWVTNYNALMETLAEEYPYVTTVSFKDVIDSDDQIQIGGNHYDRMVYLNMANSLLEAVRDLPVKVEASFPEPVVMETTVDTEATSDLEITSISPRDFKPNRSADNENAKPIRKMLSLFFGRTKA